MTLPVSAASPSGPSGSSPPPEPPNGAQPFAPDPATLFQDANQTAAYALHRPHYPQELYDALYDAALPGRRPPFPDLAAVDIATGSGQALGPIPADFGSCTALDVSGAQLAELPEALRRRVRVRLGDAHATGLPAASADLITVGQALHWFRLEEFYTECRRVLKPAGALAAWTYDFGQLYGFAGAGEMYEQLHTGTLGPFWASGRDLVDRRYAGIEPGPQHFGEVRRMQLPMDSPLELEQLVGLLRSWSAYRAYRAARPAAPDPVDAFRQQAAQRAAAGGGGGLVLRRTLTLLVALRPRPL